MAEAKQPHLNGAYYGPAIPPQTTYHRPRRGSDCCCGCCLLNLLFKFIVTLVVIIGIAVLIVWLIFRPQRVRFHVVDASLTRFNVTTNDNMLHYNLALNMTIRNPNKRVGIYYDRIEARALYDGERFDSEMLQPFYQGHKNTTNLNVEFNGNSLVLLDASQLSDFNSEKTNGVYSVDVKLYLRVRFKFGSLKSPRIKPKIECELKLPLNQNGSTAIGSFQRTKCDVDF